MDNFLSQRARGKFRKVVSATLTITTTVWLSGIALLAPALTAHAAVTINDGDLIRPSNDYKVYIVKTVGSEKFKRHLFGPQVIDAYGHLKAGYPGNVKVVDAATADGYEMSTLLRQDGDTKVYKLQNVVAGVSAERSWVKTLADFTAAGYKWNSVYVVNATEMALFTDVTTGVTTTGLSAALSASTPAGSTVARTSTDVEFAKIDFTAGTAKGFIINKLLINRAGISVDADVSDVKIFDGATQLGSTQALNTTTHKATIANLTWAIPAGTTKTLTIKATIASTNTGNAIQMGIAAASDITEKDGQVVSGTFPITGNAKTIATASVGQIDVTVQSTPSAGNVVSGSTDQAIAAWKFDASSTESFNVNKISITEVGTSVDSDISNIKLKVGSTQVGSTMASLSNSKATFTGSPLFTVAAGGNKTVTAYADIASNVSSERTIIFEISMATDAEAVGVSTGGVKAITLTGGGTYTAQTGATMTIVQGSLTITYDPSNPSAQVYVRGQTDATIAIFKFSAGANEALKVTKFAMTNDSANQDIDATEYSNVRLFIDGSATSTGHTGTVSGTLMTFEDSAGLFTVPKSGNATVTVKIDVATTADASDAIVAFLSGKTTTYLKIVGGGSGVEIPTGSITITAVDQASEATEHTASANGALTLASAPDTPAADTYALNTTGRELLRFRLTATDEAVIVSQINVRLFENNSNGASSDAVDTGEITNVKLYKSTDLNTAIDTISTPSSGVAAFNTNETVARNGTVTFVVKGDIPSSGSDYYHAEAQGRDGPGSRVTATGAASGATIVETGNSVIGNLFTKQAPTLTVSKASSPPAQTKVVSSANVVVGSFLFAASTSEDIRITSIRITADDATPIASGSAASTNFSNIKLVDTSSGAQYGSTLQLTDNSTSGDYATFSGLSVNVTKGTTKSIDVVADIVGTGTAWYFGMYGGNVTANGLSSGTTATITGISNQGDNSIQSNSTTLASAGTLTVAVDADSPTSSNVAVGVSGKTGVEFSKVKFTATTESVKIKSLRLALNHADYARDFSKVYITNASGTQLGSDGFFASGSASASIVFASGSEPVVPAAGSLILTVKGDLKGTSTGANSGDTPEVYIAGALITDSVTEEGVSSGSTGLTVSAGTPDPTTNSSGNTNFGTKALYSSVPTLAKGASSPSGASVIGQDRTVLEFTVTADSAADVILNTVAFTIGGSVDITGTGNSNLYKSTDLSNALATESYLTVANVAISAAGSVSAAITAAATAFDGVPVGSTLHIWDNTAAAYVTRQINAITTGTQFGAGTQALASISTTFAIEIGVDDVYYQPLQPDTAGVGGKLYFGAVKTLEANWLDGLEAVSFTSVPVGFAKADTVKITGYGTTGTQITSDEQIITLISNDGTNMRVTVDAGLDVSATIDFDYGQGTNPLNNSIRAVLYGTAAANNIEEVVAGGATKTFILKGDTTGATSTETLNVNIGAIADVSWDDLLSFNVTTLTAGLPITGGTLTY